MGLPRLFLSFNCQRQDYTQPRVSTGFCKENQLFTSFYLHFLIFKLFIIYSTIFSGVSLPSFLIITSGFLGSSNSKSFPITFVISFFIAFE